MVKKWEYIWIFSTMYAMFAFVMIFLTVGSVNEVDITYYTQVRNMHHSLPINGWVIASIFLLGLGAPVMYIRGRMFSAILCGFSFVLSVLSLSDRHGMIDMYFPSRIAAIGLLVLILEVIRPIPASITGFGLSALLVAMPVARNFYGMLTYEPVTLIEDYIKHKTEPDAVLLDLRGGLYSFTAGTRTEYKTERPCYVEWKFVNLYRFGEWKSRIEQVERGDFSGINYLITDFHEYIKKLLVLFSLPMGKPFGDYMIVRIKSDRAIYDLTFWNMIDYFPQIYNVGTLEEMEDEWLNS